MEILLDGEATFVALGLSHPVVQTIMDNIIRIFESLFIGIDLVVKGTTIELLYYFFRIKY